MTVKALPLTIWMNMPSHFQDDLFTALVEDGQVNLQVIFARRLTEERRNLGWKTNVEAYNHRFLNQVAPVPHAMRLAWAQRKRLHIVNGIWAEPAFTAALCVLRMTRARFAVYAEVPEAGIRRSLTKRVLRQVVGRWVARSERAALLSVSRRSREFHSTLGFASSRIYDFGYFEARHNHSVEVHPPRAEIELIYVGRLTHVKGVDILLAAIFPLFKDYPHLRLTLLGDGPDRRNLEQQVHNAGCSEYVRFAGVLPSDKVRQRMMQADALVLPSRHDGWSMVATEALIIGVPPIVSSACGIADVLRHGANGYVFRSEDVSDLRACLRRFLDSPNDRTRVRQAARRTGEALTTDAVAPYLVECLRHMANGRGDKPVPPWVALNLNLHS